MIGGELLAIILLVMLFVLAFEVWALARFLRRLWNSPLMRSLLLTGIAGIIVLSRMGTDLASLELIKLGLVAGIPIASWMEYRDVRQETAQAASTANGADRRSTQGGEPGQPATAADGQPGQGESGSQPDEQAGRSSC